MPRDVVVGADVCTVGVKEAWRDGDDIGSHLGGGDFDNKRIVAGSPEQTKQQTPAPRR